MRTILRIHGIFILFHEYINRESLTGRFRKCAEIVDVCPVKLVVGSFVVMDIFDTVSSIIENFAIVEVSQS